MSAAMEEVALIVQYQALAGRGDEVAALLAQIRPLLSERTLRFCQVVEPDG